MYIMMELQQRHTLTSAAV